MRVCVFSVVTYWHGLKGGMDLHGKHLLEGLSERGHEVIVVSTKHPSGKEYEKTNSIQIYYLKHTTFGSAKRGWSKQSVLKFREIVSEERIDLVLSQSLAGYGVAKIARRMGIPVVTIMHGYETMLFFSVLNQVRNLEKDYLLLFKSFFSCFYYSLFREFPLLMNTSMIIAVSEKVAKVISRRPFVDGNKIKVVRHGIDLSIFNPSQQKRQDTRIKLGIVDNEVAILFLSFVSKQKGANIAIKALHKLSNIRNIKLIIAGDGEYLDDAKLLVRHYHIESRTIFTGFVPNENTSQYYNAADIFIFPTLRVESFGIVIAEAMACKKPIIASNIGSIPDVIDNGVNGILFPPGDFKELSKQINRLLSDRKYSEMISQNARQKASYEFGLDRMVDETLKAFELATKPPKG